MRCKNCGTENDDNRYICETCGSPLYDEDDFEQQPLNEQRTQTFSALGNKEALDLGVTPEPDGDIEPDKSNNEDKKSIIVIAVLVVVLIAIITSIIVVAHTKSENNKGTTESTSISTTESTSKEYTSRTTTTTTTTERTTKERNWSIKLISKGGGTVEGGGEYHDGDNVTIYATPDSDYEFEGWYSNGNKISSSQQYSFTATENVSISAVFSIVTTTEPPTEKPTEATTEEPTEIQPEEPEEADGGLE